MQNINIGEQLGNVLGNLQGILNTKSVVGEPTKFGDTIIIPIVDISFGLGAGSSIKNIDNKDQASGGGGGSAKVSPVAILVINNGNVQLVNVRESDGINKLIDMAPGILSKFNFGKSTPESTHDDSETFAE